MEIADLSAVPFYNADLSDKPAAVQTLLAQMGAADALVLACPEYNYSLAPALKNALDWASRPYGAAALIRKPVVTMSSSFAFTGGVRAQAQLNETLLAIGTNLVVRPQVVIGEVHTKVEDGRLTAKTSLDYALAAVADLVKAIEAARQPAYA